jgi:hypothetical protein
MRNQLILAAGFLLSSCLPVEAQTPSAQIVLAETSPPPVVPMILVFRASPIRASTELPEQPLPHYSAPHPTPLLAAAYKPDPSLGSQLGIDEFRTPMLTESSLPVANLWRGLNLDAFESTSHAPSLWRFSPTSGAGFEDLRPRSSDQASIGSSVGRSGLSLRYRFGRDAARKPSQILRCVSWVIGNGRGCPL